MPRPIHFEIQAQSTERAIAFYRALSVGCLAYAKDAEGDIFGMMRLDANAA